MNIHVAISNWLANGKRYEREMPKPIITIDRILNVVCTHYNCSIEDFKSTARYARIRRPRQVFTYIVRQLMPKLKLIEIARYLNQYHTTIIHSVKVIENELRQIDVRQELDSIISKITNNGQP